MGRVAAEGMTGPGVRCSAGGPTRTFTAGPNQTDNPFTEVLDNTRKYVALHDAAGAAPLAELHLLEGDAAGRGSAQGGAGRGPDGAGQRRAGPVAAARDLVDRYVLLIHPLVLGSGRRLFPDGGPAATLRLVDSVPTTTGVIIATYQPTAREGASR